MLCLIPIVVGDDVEAFRFVFYSDHFIRQMRTLAGFPDIRVLGAHHFGEVGAIHLWNGARLGDQLLGIDFQRRDHAAHHAVVAQMAHQSARVNVAEHRNLELFEIFFGDLLRAPVGADSRKLAHDQALDIRARGFVVFRVGSVIADFRIGENYDLAGVGRIGENFLIAGDGSIENHFPVTFAFCSVAFAAEDSAVFQRKDSLHSRSEEWILKILTGMRKCAMEMSVKILAVRFDLYTIFFSKLR